MDKQIIQVKTMRNSRGHSGLNFKKLSTNKTSIEILQEATLVSASFKRDRVYTVNLERSAPLFVLQQRLKTVANWQ